MPLSAISNSTFISHVDIHRSSANVSTFTRHSSPFATTNHLIHRRAAIMGGMHEVRQAPPPPAVILSALAAGVEGSLDGKERCTTQPKRDSSTSLGMTVGLGRRFSTHGHSERSGCPLGEPESRNLSLNRASSYRRNGPPTLTAVVVGLQSARHRDHRADVPARRLDAPGPHR